MTPAANVAAAAALLSFCSQHKTCQLMLLSVCICCLITSCAYDESQTETEDNVTE